MKKKQKREEKKPAAMKKFIRKEIKARIDNKQHYLILAGCF